MVIKAIITQFMLSLHENCHYKLLEIVSKISSKNSIINFSKMLGEKDQARNQLNIKNTFCVITLHGNRRFRASGGVDMATLYSLFLI